MEAGGKGLDALLVSPLITPSPGGDCLSFWYSIIGPESAGLEVLLQKGRSEGNPVWSKKGSQHSEELVNAVVTIEEKNQYNVSSTRFDRRSLVTRWL
jgi:hypothetical protein